MTTHTWRQLSAEQVPSSPSEPVLPPFYQEVHRRLDTVETVLRGHDLRLGDHVNIHDHLQLSLDEQAEHGHPDLERKIGDVHETMAAVLRRSLQNRDTAQKTAHEELKAAFGELAARLEAIKGNHADLAGEVVDLGDYQATLDNYFNNLSEGLTDTELRVLDLERRPRIPAAIVQNRANWPAYLAMLLALVAIALHFMI